MTEVSIKPFNTIGETPPGSDYILNTTPLVNRIQEQITPGMFDDNNWEQKAQDLYRSTLTVGTSIEEQLAAVEELLSQKDISDNPEAITKLVDLFHKEIINNRAEGIEIELKNNPAFLSVIERDHKYSPQDLKEYARTIATKRNSTFIKIYHQLSPKEKQDPSIIDFIGFQIGLHENPQSYSDPLLTEQILANVRDKEATFQRKETYQEYAKSLLHQSDVVTEKEYDPVLDMLNAIIEEEAERYPDLSANTVRLDVIRLLKKNNLLPQDYIPPQFEKNKPTVSVDNPYTIPVQEVLSSQNSYPASAEDDLLVKLLEAAQKPAEIEPELDQASKDAQLLEQLVLSSVELQKKEKKPLALADLRKEQLEHYLTEEHERVADNARINRVMDRISKLRALDKKLLFTVQNALTAREGRGLFKNASLKRTLASMANGAVGAKLYQLHTIFSNTELSHKFQYGIMGGSYLLTQLRAFHSEDVRKYSLLKVPRAILSSIRHPIQATKSVGNSIKENTQEIIKTPRKLLTVPVAPLLFGLKVTRDTAADLASRLNPVRIARQAKEHIQLDMLGKTVLQGGARIATTAGLTYVMSRFGIIADHTDLSTLAMQATALQLAAKGSLNALGISGIGETAISYLFNHKSRVDRTAQWLHSNFMDIMPTAYENSNNPPSQEDVLSGLPKEYTFLPTLIRSKKAAHLGESEEEYSEYLHSQSAKDLQQQAEKLEEMRQLLTWQIAANPSRFTEREINKNGHVELLNNRVVLSQIWELEEHLLNIAEQGRLQAKINKDTNQMAHYERTIKTLMTQENLQMHVFKRRLASMVPGVGFSAAMVKLHETGAFAQVMDTLFGKEHNAYPTESLTQGRLIDMNNRTPEQQAQSNELVLRTAFDHPEAILPMLLDGKITIDGQEHLVPIETMRMFSQDQMPLKFIDPTTGSTAFVMHKEIWAPVDNPPSRFINWAKQLEGPNYQPGQPFDYAANLAKDSIRKVIQGEFGMIGSGGRSDIGMQFVKLLAGKIDEKALANPEFSAQLYHPEQYGPEYLAELMGSIDQDQVPPELLQDFQLKDDLNEYLAQPQREEHFLSKLPAGKTIGSLCMQYERLAAALRISANYSEEEMIREYGNNISLASAPDTGLEIRGWGGMSTYLFGDGDLNKRNEAEQLLIISIQNEPSTYLKALKDGNIDVLTSRVENQALRLYNRQQISEQELTLIRSQIQEMNKPGYFSAKTPDEYKNFGLDNEVGLTGDTRKYVEQIVFAGKLRENQIDSLNKLSPFIFGKEDINTRNAAERLLLMSIMNEPQTYLKAIESGDSESIVNHLTTQINKLDKQGLISTTDKNNMLEQIGLMTSPGYFVKQSSLHYENLTFSSPILMSLENKDFIDTVLFNKHIEGARIEDFANNEQAISIAAADYISAQEIRFILPALPEIPQPYDITTLPDTSRRFDFAPTYTELQQSIEQSLTEKTKIIKGVSYRYYEMLIDKNRKVKIPEFRGNPGLAISTVDEVGNVIGHYEGSYFLSAPPVLVGSTIKPLIAGFLAQNGIINNFNDPVSDISGNYGLETGLKVTNATPDMGTMTWRDTLAQSRNVPFVKGMSQYLNNHPGGIEAGWKEFQDYLGKLGIQMTDAQGNYMTSPTDLAVIGSDAYITSIRNSDGRIIENSLDAYARANLVFAKPELFEDFADDPHAIETFKQVGLIMSDDKLRASKYSIWNKQGLKDLKSELSFGTGGVKTGTVTSSAGTTDLLTVFFGTDEKGRTTVTVSHIGGERQIGTNPDGSPIFKQINLDLEKNLTGVGAESSYSALPAARRFLNEIMGLRQKEVLPIPRTEEVLASMKTMFEPNSNTPISMRTVVTASPIAPLSPTNAPITTIPTGTAIDLVGDPIDGLQQIIWVDHEQLKIGYIPTKTADILAPVSDQLDQFDKPQLDTFTNLIERLDQTATLEKISNPDSVSLLEKIDPDSTLKKTQLLFVDSQESSPLLNHIYQTMKKTNNLTASSETYGKALQALGFDSQNVVIVNKDLYEEYVGTSKANSITEELFLRAVKHSSEQSKLQHILNTSYPNLTLDTLMWNETTRTPTHALIMGLSDYRYNTNSTIEFQGETITRLIEFPYDPSHPRYTEFTRLRNINELYQDIMTKYDKNMPINHIDIERLTLLLDQLNTDPTDAELVALGMKEGYVPYNDLQEQSIPNIASKQK